MGWYSDNGDTILRLNYPLNYDSIVFDIGGYEGKWSHDIWKLYKCNIFIFEPVPEFYSKINNSFQDVDNIKIFNYGVHTHSFETEFHIHNDESSKNISKGTKIMVNFRSIKDIIEENNITKIDLMKINIEGDEYDLLDYMIEQNITDIISDIQIQFHNWIPNAIERRKNIQSNLEKTHYNKYNYDFIWENWTKKI